MCCFLIAHIKLEEKPNDVHQIYTDEITIQLASVAQIGPPPCPPCAHSHDE